MTNNLIPIEQIEADGGFTAIENCDKFVEVLAGMSLPGRTITIEDCRVSMLKTMGQDASRGLAKREFVAELAKHWGMPEPDMRSGWEREIDERKADWAANKAKNEADFARLHPVKAKPEGTRVCSKCGGTGFFCLYFENGQAKSNTGFQCYPCHGTGYISTGRRPVKKN